MYSDCLKYERFCRHFMSVGDHPGTANCKRGVVVVSRPKVVLAKGE
jgi:hypothetical protein